MAAEYCTLVNFGATYAEGVYIDSKLTKPWGTAYNAWMLMMQVEDRDTKLHIFDSLPADVSAAVQEMNRAYHGMQLRAQFNGDRINGPHIFHSETPPDDAALLAWAKANVFKRNHKGE